MSQAEAGSQHCAGPITRRGQSVIDNIFQRPSDIVIQNIATMEKMSFMLQEQRKINDELMSQMREMQMTMQDMRTRMGPSGSRDTGAGSYVGGGDMDFSSFGSGYGEGGYGGGKMFSSYLSSMSGARSLPYNNRVPKHEGDWDW